MHTHSLNHSHTFILNPQHSAANFSIKGQKVLVCGAKGGLHHSENYIKAHNLLKGVSQDASGLRIVQQKFGWILRKHTGHDLTY